VSNLLTEMPKPSPSMARVIFSPSSHPFVFPFCLLNPRDCYGSKVTGIKHPLRGDEK